MEGPTVQVIIKLGREGKNKVDDIQEKEHYRQKKKSNGKKARRANELGIFEEYGRSLGWPEQIESFERKLECKSEYRSNRRALGAQWHTM